MENNTVIKPARARKLPRSRLLNQLSLQSMVWPALICLIVFAYIPMYGVSIAFFDYNIVRGIGDFAGFRYFKEFLTDRNIFLILRNTLGINLLCLFVAYPMPIILALFFNELRVPWFKKTAQTVSYLPHFLSWVIYGGLLLDIMSGQGIINAALMLFGIIDKPIIFINLERPFWGIITIAHTIKSMGFSAILFIAAIGGVDLELYDAANMDGCGRFRKMWHVTVPGISGTIVITLILCLSGILNTGVEHLLMMQNGLNYAYSQTIDTYVYRIGISNFRYSYATAVGLLKSGVGIILLLTANVVCKKIADKGLF